VRSDGYDVSSSIVNGMSRTVDVLDVMGLWGDGGGGATGASGRLRMQQMSKNDTLDYEMSGGRSDTSYQRRLHFQSLAAAGVSAEAAMGDVNAPGSKMLSARERLQQEELQLLGIPHTTQQASRHGHPARPRLASTDALVIACITNTFSCAEQATTAPDRDGTDVVAAKQFTG
jgi:hypothetical protein